MKLIQTLQQHANSIPDAIALKNDCLTLSYSELIFEIDQAKQLIKLHQQHCTIALAVDNHPAWAILDIACLVNKIPLVPLPAFFSDTQLMHTVKDAGASILITDNPQRFTALFDYLITQQSTITVAGKRLMMLHVTIAPQSLPTSTAKITYTSGTTGRPKGVCLSEQTMLNVASSIKKMVNLRANDQHCCVLPLSTLLENVAGLYAILLAGGTAHMLPNEMVGLTGSSLNIHQLHHTLQRTQANTAIFIPELLNALVTACEAGAAKLYHLRFLAVGGASVAPALLARAKQLGLPVFEGYGLSESASVVALNHVGKNKVGSVGQLLPHLEMMFSDEQEILVKGAQYLGYTNQPSARQPAWLATGDIGYLDADGYLFINGRKKNIFITSYGRNVSPEWVERDLTSTAVIAQACLFGEAKPWNTAIIVLKANATIKAINATIDMINQSLPDYARVSKWLLASEAFSVNNNQLTPNGRLKRDVIWQSYQHAIEALYKSEYTSFI
jgi:long-subunit acyl-CoA synthetase (AMP-forming)